MSKINVSIFLLFLLIYLTGCSSFSTMMDANTLPSGKMKLVGFVGTSYTEDEILVDHGFFTGTASKGMEKDLDFMPLNLFFRIGLFPRVDVGVKWMNIYSVDFDMKINILHESKFLPAFAFDFGYGFGSLYNRALENAIIDYYGHRPFLQLLSHKSVSDNLLLIIGYKYAFTKSIYGTTPLNFDFQILNTGFKYNLQKEKDGLYLTFEVDYILNIKDVDFRQQEYIIGAEESIQFIKSFIAHKRIDFLFGVGFDF